MVATGMLTPENCTPVLEVGASSSKVNTTKSRIKINEVPVLHPLFTPVTLTLISTRQQPGAGTPHPLAFESALCFGSKRRTIKRLRLSVQQQQCDGGSQHQDHPHHEDHLWTTATAAQALVSVGTGGGELGGGGGKQRS